MLAEQATGTLERRYQGELLDVAFDFGQRLLPAFSASPTGLPYAWCVWWRVCRPSTQPRVNLKTGVRPDEVTESNSAACGTLLLEFGVLSRLTGAYVGWCAGSKSVPACLNTTYRRGRAL